jgi:hypothetical protein
MSSWVLPRLTTATAQEPVNAMTPSVATGEDRHRDLQHGSDQGSSPPHSVGMKMARGGPRSGEGACWADPS